MMGPHYGPDMPEQPPEGYRPPGWKAPPDPLVEQARREAAAMLPCHSDTDACDSDSHTHVTDCDARLRSVFAAVILRALKAEAAVEAVKIPWTDHKPFHGRRNTECPWNAFDAALERIEHDV